MDEVTEFDQSRSDLDDANAALSDSASPGCEGMLALSHQRRTGMKRIRTAIQGVLLVGSAMLATGCIVEPRNDYYDHDHHRYYHEHSWHDCGDHDDHCR